MNKWEKTLMALRADDVANEDEVRNGVMAPPYARACVFDVVQVVFVCLLYLWARRLRLG